MATYGSLELKLLRDYFQYWLDWNKNSRNQENLHTDNNTAIACVPPHWPSRGAMENWINTLNKAIKLVEDNDNDASDHS